MLDITNHPCFNDKSRHKFARVHLPVAPKCNIQCNFCDRRFDCFNESRPGVSSAILSPYQALAYLDKVCAARKDISVAGIAGPGDPFANPGETMETLRLVRKAYPKLLLCVATNGLNLLPYVDELAELKVSHVSITINAVDPAIGQKIYAWVRDGVNIYRGIEAAEVLLLRQMSALSGIKKLGITVKVNSIIIPGVNDFHIADLAKKISAAGADIINAIPLYRVQGTAFENVVSPSPELVSECRRQAAVFIPTMNHCARCRSDAVGLLGENFDVEAASLLQSCAALPLLPQEGRPYVACASREGALINLHLGHAEKFHIFCQDADAYKLIDIRNAPGRGSGANRWQELAGVLKDCRAVIAESAGAAPREALAKYGLRVVTMTGLVAEGLDAIYNKTNVSGLIGPGSCSCGKCVEKTSQSPGCGCSGSGGGCG